ncbi:hypothetical protein Psal006b_02648 [Piscirickettsia salmonis]|uniref:Uncharacterized protein n=1 Tax=Piscirickettsia salmonis TaxID=1238 RepID=A0AAC8ZNH0_PISSA|nr:hypothetical protein KU39_569 [Piscirickettsia salmonis]QGN99631.1 hypothetical protein Psal006b_02648 [Piscirickettsia salmonis]QGO03278.1 hypothetical protein Psal008_02678 [Piscirickettsia salmonis]QGO13917.1 hypothetical protein Psal010b_02642 [Piscirickettsia salmonis]QGO21009.1 hypothetical protein Psal013_02684 [Piscirickettsia salmonis]
MDFQGIKKQVLSLLGQIYLHESEDEDNYVHVARARLACSGQVILDTFN